jgi:hypothetical protein
MAMDEIMQTDAETALRERAIKHLKKRRDFQGHVLVYALFNAFLVLIWALTPSWGGASPSS